MLNLRWIRVTMPPPAVPHHRDDLKVRNLLDDPRLRRAVGLDPNGSEMPEVRARPMPDVRFDRRRLLDRAAAA